MEESKLLLHRLHRAGVRIRPRGELGRSDAMANVWVAAGALDVELELPLATELPHLSEALTHPSFANEHRGGPRVDNQRLEFLGDAVLGLLAGELLMEQFPGADEGELSLMRSLLVNADALAAWARGIDLGAALQLGRGADIAGERETANVLADAVEALVGAFHIDCEPGSTRQLVANIVAGPLGRLATGGAVARDAKSELQQQVQSAGAPSPRYRVIETKGPDHRRVFVVVVEVDGTIVGEGRGRSKKLAEQAAARAALELRDPRTTEAPASSVIVYSVPASGSPEPGVSQ